MEWNENEIDYPIIKLSDSHEEGLSHWISKILELSREYDGSWDVLIADLWPNDQYDRLIGNVQMNNQPIGTDIGYRVCANLSGPPLGGEELFEADFNYLELKLIEAVELEPAKSIIDEVNAGNPFEIRYTAYGEGPVSKTLPIWPYCL